MYHPYLRGKQNELIAVRESAKLMADCSFVPIIEPVKESLNNLKRTVEAVVEAKGKAIIVINPSHGYFSNDRDSLLNFLFTNFADQDTIYAGILLKNSMSVDDVIGRCDASSDHSHALIHAGFSEAKDLALELGEQSKSLLHIFFEADCGKLYQRHFKQGTRILVRDGFQSRRNREYPPIELFSDLHVTFEEEEGMNGFGDFLIVGDEFSETGGPAYAVAIHLTFIDSDKDDAMYVYHFVSDRQDTPMDPAGKFAEALDKLITRLSQPNSKVQETNAVAEFRELHSRGHFPGLGFIKKLSMQHHIETLADHCAK